MSVYKIVRSVDQLGRVVLPAEFRRELGIELGDPLDILLLDDRIEIHKPVPICRLCGGQEHLTKRGRVWICCGCMESLVR